MRTDGPLLWSCQYSYFHIVMKRKGWFQFCMKPDNSLPSPVPQITCCMMHGAVCFLSVQYIYSHISSDFLPRESECVRGGGGTFHVLMTSCCLYCWQFSSSTSWTIFTQLDRDGIHRTHRSAVVISCCSQRTATCTYIHTYICTYELLWVVSEAQTYWLTHFHCAFIWCAAYREHRNKRAGRRITWILRRCLYWLQFFENWENYQMAESK